jgi:lipid-binding SYLF domain-containing protein
VPALVSKIGREATDFVLLVMNGKRRKFGDVQQGQIGGRMTNLFVLSTARGAGVAFNSTTKQETFMKMVSAGGGLGVGVKDYRVVFAFETEQALKNFLNSGWSGSGQADAAAKTSKSGGAYSGAAMVEPGVWVYQITEKGLALPLTLQGTKYYKDDDLNES